MKKTLAVLALTGLAAVPLVAAPESAHGRGGMAPDFETLDQNADGVITAEELAAQHAARFAEADSDGDGLLTSDELAAAAAQAQAARMQQGAERMISRFDKDEDGALSADEVPQGPVEGMFARLDANEDGQIDADEFAARGPGKMAGGKGGHQGHDGPRGHHGFGDHDGGFWR